MNKQRIIPLSYIFFMTSSLSGKTVLSESLLIKMARSQSINRAAAELSYSQAKMTELKNNDRFSPKFSASGDFGQTDRQQVNKFQPVMTPTKNFSISLSKKHSLGLSSELSAFGNEFSSSDGAINQASTFGTKLSIKADLLKNLLGRNDKETSASAEYNSKKQKLKNQIDQKRFEAFVRKIYWGIMANRESVKISEKLVQLAQKQVQEAKNRQNLAVAEKGEIARYNSQLSQAKTNIILLDYQYQSLLINLRTNLPSLTDEDLLFPLEDLAPMTEKVMQCTELIKSKKKLPWSFTKADEIIRLAEQSIEADNKVIRNKGGANLNFKTDFEYTGVEKGFEKSSSQYVEDGRFGYNIGLEFSMPLGETSDRLRETELHLKESQLSLEKQQITNALKARHMQMAQLIDLLYSSAMLQGSSSSSLSIVARDSSEKYNQARITVDQIIRDQNALQISLLDRLETRSKVMSELLDYFADFTETPCQLNQL